MNNSRFPFTKTIRDSRGRPIASVTVHIVLESKPTYSEMRYLWLHKNAGPQNGVFVRRLTVKPAERNQGYGTMLIEDVILLAKPYNMPVYIDLPVTSMTPDSDPEKEKLRKDPRRWIRSLGFRESIFWYNARGKPLVRYRYY